MSNHGDNINAALARVGPGASVEDVAAALNLVEAVQRRAKEVRAELEARLLEKVEADGPVVVGDVRYWSGVESETRCIDKVAALDALIHACEGDLGRLAADALAAQPFKAGACRGLLPAEAFWRAFVTAEKVVLKEGAPRKKLMRADTRFLPPGRTS